MMASPFDVAAGPRTAPLPARHLPAAEPLHGRQHVLRLRLHRVLDARRARHGRAVHRHRHRARHARRPHRAHDEHDERVRRRVRFAGRRHLVRRRAGGARVRVGTVGARAGRLGGRLHVRHAPRRCGSRASTSRSRTQLDKRYFVGMPSPAAAGVVGRDGLRLAVSAATGYPQVDRRRVARRARARGADGQHDPVPQLQDDQLRLGPVVPAAVLFIALFIAFIATEPRITLVMLAYGYLLSAFVELGDHAAADAGARSRHRQRHRNGRPRAGRARRARSSRRTARCCASHWPGRGRSPPSSSRSRARTRAARASASMPDAGVARSSSATSSGRRRAPRRVSVPPSGIACTRVLDEVRQRAREQRAIDPTRRQRRRARRRRSRCVRPSPSRYGSTTSSTSIGERRRLRAAASARRRSSRTPTRSAAAAGPGRGSSSRTDRTTAPSGRPRSSCTRCRCSAAS